MNTYREVRPSNESYAVVMKRNIINDETYDSLRLIIIYYLTQIDNVLRKEEKKIIIRILDKMKRRKIYKKKTKELIERIKKIISKLIRINKIKSKNIKIIILI